LLFFEVSADMARVKIVPQHVVVIPDGNRRWAKKHGLEALEGHKKGLEKALEMVRKSKEIGVKVLTIWGFSTENWNRPNSEVKYLMALYQIFLKRHINELVKEGVQFKWLGRRDRVPSALKNILEGLEKKTKTNSKYLLNICLDYGGRDELVRAFQKLLKKKLKPSQITEEMISKSLDTAGIPDPDLLIRTSGEKRTSGILPWQTTYTEFYFSKLYFPDFSTQELQKAFRDYAARQRRYGS